MEEAFAKYLAAYGPLIALVSDRIDWALRPQAKNTPAIALFNISSIPFSSDEGDAGLTSCRVQVDCWAKTYALAKDVSRKVTDRLGGVNKSFTFTQDGIDFQTSFKEDEQDSFEQGAAAEDLFRVRLDFILLYK